MFCALIGPRHEKTCLRAYADSEGPDQPAHPRNLIRASTVRYQNQWILPECMNGEQKPICAYFQSLSGTRVCFIVKKSGKGFKYTCLEMGSCLPASRKHAYINLTPLKPHFYIVKLGLTGVHTIFLISQLKNIDCGYSLEPLRRGGSNEYPQSMFRAAI